MNPEQIFNSLHRSLQTALGATVSLVETLQDEAQRDQLYTKIQSQPTAAEFSYWLEAWAARGEAQEQAAMQLVDAIFSRSAGGPPAPESQGLQVPPSLQGELQELTQHLATLRQDLEQSRRQEI